MSDGPTVLLLDVMDTLVRDPFWDIPTFFGQPFEEIWQGKDPASWIDFELGRIDSDTFLRTFWTDGRDYDRAAFAALFRDGYRWIDGIEPLLAELHAAGVEMHALSNYPSWYHWIEERLEPSRYLSWSFVSCDVGVRKPDAGAYTGPAERLGRPTSDFLFVDDRGRNCKGAAAVGMPAIKFVGAEPLRAELVRRGFLPE